MNGEYTSKLKSEEMDFLFDAILKLTDKEECYRFFEDVCTINEIKALAQRMQVAKMLIDRKTYLDIAASTGASTATISRVNRALNYGCNGYKLVFEKLKYKP
ncbi:YerC/YecD family TrpR-related protein [Haloimpatiens sp. FM7315]|uniref:YerC/YecD family TrpR-related protein n=1 Tax=Haloimpatiens sp. FM7315 TaxID=3298609 RepID=UPI0035A27563